MKNKITAKTTWREFLESNFEELVGISPLSGIVCKLCPYARRCEEEVTAADTSWWITPSFRCNDGYKAVLNSPIGEKVDFELFESTILRFHEPLNALVHNGLKNLKK